MTDRTAGEHRLSNNKAREYLEYRLQLPLDQAVGEVVGYAVWDPDTQSMKDIPAIFRGILYLEDRRDTLVVIEPKSIHKCEVECTHYSFISRHSETPAPTLFDARAKIA